MQNVITASNYTFTVAKKQLPFTNNFVQDTATVEQYMGKDEIRAIVTCTANSKEPGRVYSVIYSTKGQLIACNTLN